MDNDQSIQCNPLTIDPEVMELIAKTEAEVNQTLTALLAAENIPEEQQQTVIAYYWNQINEFSEITKYVSSNALQAYTQYLRTNTDYSPAVIALCLMNIKLFLYEAVNQGMPTEMLFFWL